jgi:hypothetical protein
MLACAKLNQLHSKKSLAIPELSLLHTAKSIRSEDPLAKEICAGISASLKIIVDQHCSEIERIQKIVGTSKYLSICPTTDADLNPALSPIDAYGYEDFSCILCHKELSNVYFHCDGCEKIYARDFNICVRCHSLKKHLVVYLMAGMCTVEQSQYNHTGKCFHSLFTAFSYFI